MKTIVQDKAGRTTLEGGDPLSVVAEGLIRRLSALRNEPTVRVLHVLHELLDGQDQQARRARLEMQMHLVKVSAGVLPASGPTDGDEELSTQEAAELMGCSRPYVVMLIDSGKLAGGSKTEGGHRRIRRSSVQQWIAERQKADTGNASPDYRAAARDAGMYAIPDEAFLSDRKGARGPRGA
ncbi:excisionase family DNA-binding protein [Caballeronia mineralivorans]|jgi:excisionase family DNA binding protein|uniref:excisionase family DNA-binding protein n=1 Tax=Caballeronia mineralivorans TaxID=2010198 RepID=UPI002AFDF6CF|nr:excisionase family DNA-binding protein [Caballeronia mineralivorans]MEA3104889.1 hypothetical protein [Caballeronia mineralivorans]